MKSSFFYNKHYLAIAEKVKRKIDSSQDFLSDVTAQSPRAVGDAVEKIVATEFDGLLGSWCKEYSPAFGRRAMADFAFQDKEGFYCIVDVKTHRADTRFNMPALTSVERLARLYEDDFNVFTILMIKYAIAGNRIKALDVHFFPIEFIDWSCLTVGALAGDKFKSSTPIILFSSTAIRENGGC